MQRVQTAGAVKFSESKSQGVRSVNLAQKEIGMVLSGSKRIYHDDSVTIAERGDIFLLCEGLHHIEDCPSERGFEQIVFYISAEDLHRHIVAMINDYGVECFDNHRCSRCNNHNFVVTPATPSLKEFFTSINSSFAHHAEGGEKLRHLRIAELIYHILCSEDKCLRRRLLMGADVDNVRFTCQIYDNILKDASIENLARQTNRSLTSFKKEFRRHFATSPHKWYIEQRLQLAKTLLVSTNMTISQIGIHCCFTNISHFIKLFKHRFHTTPAALRREFNAKNETTSV
ncbi:MAG: helix-turn-helix transcriptional regulator [Alistipes sp.]|nr:helix-turn-helix transcriptional regulator [Alistipes sp.]